MDQTKNENYSPTLTRAFIFVETEDFRRAMEYCEKELDANPTNGDAYFCLLMAERHVSDKEKLKDIKCIETQKNFQLAKKFASDALLQELENIEKYRQETEKLEKIARENIEKEREEKLNRLNLIKKESWERYLILRQHLSAAKKLKEKKEVLKVLESALHYEKILSENDNPDDLTVEEVKSQTEQALAQAGSLDEKLELINKNSLKNRAKLKKKVAIFLGVILILAAALIIKFMIDQERREIAEKMGLVLGKWDTSCLIGFTGSLGEYELPDFITKIDINWKDELSPLSGADKLTISKNVTSITKESLFGIYQVEVSPENKVFVKGKNDDVINKKEKRLIHIKRDLTEYTITNDIEFVDSSVFITLKVVKLESGNKNLVLGDAGELIDKKSKTLLFYPMDSDEKYTIPESIEHIGNYAFHERKNLRKIVIPDHVKTIGFGAFQGCTEIEEIEIPKSVKAIEGSAFIGTKKVSVAANNKNFKTGEKGELIDIKNRTLIYVPQDIAGEYTVPADIKKIGFASFSNCKYLKQIDIPDSVKIIGSFAFFGCSSLEKISLSTKLKTIGNFAFADCNKLEKITLPNELKTIGIDAFANCSKLKEITIPENVADIGSRSFSGIDVIKVSPKNKNFRMDKNKILIDCNKKKILYCSTDFKGKYNVPEDIVSIEYQAFKGCTELEKITLPDGLKIIGANAFADCSKLKEISFPKGVKTIGTRAFLRCSGLAKVSFSNGLEIIGAGAFGDCSNLDNITIPETVVNIGGYAFPSGIKKIKISQKNKHFKMDKDKVLVDIQRKKILRCLPDFKGTYKVPNDIVSIANCAFIECSELEEIILPKGLKKIEHSAFSGCKKLKKITLPESLEKIGGSAFFRCYELEEISIQNGVKSIEAYAFYECVKLKKITLPESLEKIGGFAFYLCSDLKEINLPKGLKKIENRAFSGCNKLEEITIPESVEFLDPSVIGDIKKVKISPKNKNYRIDKDKVLIDCNKKKIVRCSQDFKGKYTVPEDIETIGSNAFSGCSSLEEINLPKGLKIIENGAFSRCYKLQEITIPESVTVLEYGAINDIKNIKISPKNKNFKLDKDNILIDCNRKKIILCSKDFKGKYTIPVNIETIETNAFNRCFYLEEITFPKSLKVIKSCAFSGCFSLKEITLPKGVKTIEPHAFSGCSSLKTIILPESLEKVGEGAFEGCSSLREITLPDSLEIVERGVFLDTRLTKIYIPKHFSNNEIKEWGLPEDCEIIKK